MKGCGCVATRSVFKERDTHPLYFNAPDFLAHLCVTARPRPPSPQSW